MSTGIADGYKTVYSAKPLRVFGKGIAWHEALIDAATLVWAILCHLILTSWPYTGVAILIGSVYSIALKYISIFAISTLLLPRCPHWQSIIDRLDMLVFQHWRRYISYKVTYHGAVDPDAQYCFVEFPHGVFPLAGQMHAAIWTRLHSRRLTLMAADVLFYIPLWRHYMSVGGCAPATRPVFHRALERGECVGVHAGGIAEMFVCEKDREVIVLRRRRGFVRIAVEHGVPLVPVYHFGNSRLLTLGPRWLQKVSRRLRMSLGMVYGRLGLPLPRQMPVWTVVGEPVDVGPPTARSTPGFDEQVEAVHARFSAAIEKLYYEHRDKFVDGAKTWADRDLVIM